LDFELLFEWRNDPLTRKYSIKRESVSREEHERWLRASIENQDRRLLIAEVDGEPIGTVRLDRHESEWELSWTVAPSARGKGLGKKMVSAATGLVSESLIARVRADNLASRRIAEHAGFTTAERSDELVTYRLLKGRDDSKNLID
jgi:RimJ/RimL family protein N-acetyltransferase